MNQILYVYFGENVQWDKITFSTFCRRPTFVFSLLFIISIGFFMHGCLTKQALLFANQPRQIIDNYELWRLFTAPFAVTGEAISLLGLLGSFWWLLSLLPDQENRYSSIHLLIQIFFQNFLIQFTYLLVATQLSFITSYFKKSFDKGEFVCFGWDPLIILWIFLITGRRKDHQSRLFYLPFKIRNQYFVWIISVWTIFFSHSKLSLIIATILGAVQFHFLQKSFLHLPYKVYLYLQKPFLNCSKYFTTFVKLGQVKRNHYEMYHEQFQQIYGKQQYFIRPYSENQIQLVFKSAQLDLPRFRINKELEMWARSDSRKRKNNSII